MKIGKAKVRLIAFFSALLVGASMAARAQMPTATAMPKGNEKGLESFQRNVFPLLVEKCAACHSRMDGEAPRHTIPDDPALTYSLIRRYVADFGDLRNSKLVTQGTRMDMAGGSLSADDFVAALQRWWDQGEKTAFFEGKKLLSAQKIPTLPQDGSFVSIQWDLGQADERFRGTRFEIEIQKTPGAYRIHDPKIIAGGQQQIEVQGIHLVMNGIWISIANSYANVSTTVPGDGVLSHAYQLVLEAKGEGSDEIAFAFEKLEPSSLERPAASADFDRPAPAPAAKLGSNDLISAAHFVPIAVPAEFEMGFLGEINDSEIDESVHRVRLTRPFEIQATLVTQLQWYMVMRGTPMATPSRFKDPSQCDEGSVPEPQEHLPPMCKHHPVEQIRWEDAQEFIRRLNASQSAYTYRLPTEAEWEYVARAGMPVEYNYGWGNDFDPQYAWCRDNSNSRTHAVATRLPTRAPQDPTAKLYDMAGNVNEWIQDYYGRYPGDSYREYPFPEAPVQVDPQGAVFPKGATPPFQDSRPEKNMYHGLRGGAYDSDNNTYLAASRRSYYGGHGPNDMSGDIGFRLVRSKNEHPLPRPSLTPPAAGPPRKPRH